MGNAYGEKDQYIMAHDNIGGHPYNNDGFGSGGFMTILMAVALLVIVLFFIFRRDRRDEGEFVGRGRGCGGCDEDNWETDRHLTDKVWITDRDVLLQNEQTRHTEVDQGEKTRAVVVHEAEKQDAKEFQKTLYAMSQKDSEIAALKAEKYIDNKLEKIEAKICRVDEAVLVGNVRRSYPRREYLVEEGCDY